MGNGLKWQGVSGGPKDGTPMAGFISGGKGGCYQDPM